MPKRKLPPLAVFGFLAPNFLGFLFFTLFPVLLSFWMAFTNWSLRPAVKREFLGLRNFSDLLGVRALDQPNPTIEWAYIIAAVVLVIGLITALWANVAEWRGTRTGGAIMTLLGFAIIASAFHSQADQGVYVAGMALMFCGIISTSREGSGWRPGWGTAPSLLLLGSAMALGMLSSQMWSLYEPRDARFWQYFYNTVFMMIGIPFSIGGSLALALLLNDELPLGSGRMRALGAALCMACGIVTMLLLWSFNANIALMGSILWLIAALAMAFNIVTFRTIFYLPTFTAGVALMILWKALYNPSTGPINLGIVGILHALGYQGDVSTMPQWLANVEWAKPALIFMGVWTGIGGTNMLLYLAGLSNVPRELLDAAEVDGASGWTRFRHVTWPQLAPTTFFISIMSIIGGLQGGFESARVMTNGGPAGSTTTLSFYIYNKAFQDLDLGYAAAISWVLFAIIFVATALNWKFGRELEVDQ